MVANNGPWESHKESPIDAELKTQAKPQNNYNAGRETCIISQVFQITARNIPLLRPTQVTESQSPELNYLHSKTLKFMMTKHYFDKNKWIISVHKREMF